MILLKGDVILKRSISDLANLFSNIRYKNKINFVYYSLQNKDKSYFNVIKRTAALISNKIEVNFILEENKTKVDILNNFEKIVESSDFILIDQPVVSKYVNLYDFIRILPPYKDIEAITPYHLSRLIIGESIAYPITPKAVITLLEYYNIDLEGKDVAVVNRSLVLGKPLVYLLLQKNASVFIFHSKTLNLEEKLKAADIVIIGIGKLRFFNRNYFTKGQIIVDVGVNWDETQHRLVGDVDFEDVYDMCEAISPVPSGIGPVGLKELFYNMYNLLRWRYEKDHIL